MDFHTKTSLDKCGRVFVVPFWSAFSGPELSLKPSIKNQDHDDQLEVPSNAFISNLEKGEKTKKYEKLINISLKEAQPVIYPKAEVSFC